MPALTITAVTRPNPAHLAACEVTVDGRSFTFATYEGTVRVGRHSETRDIVALQPSLGGRSTDAGYGQARTAAIVWLRQAAGETRLAADAARAEQARIRAANRGSNAMIG